MINLASRQKGVGLIEVMVSLCLLAIAVLGYIALQTQAIRATDESFERSQSLVMMGNLAEKIRANPSAINTYQQALNRETNNIPANQCGLDGGSITATDLCTPTQLATADIFQFKQELTAYGFDIKMYPCPNTSGTAISAKNNIMFSYCVISAWGNTTATIGSKSKLGKNNTTIDCLSERKVEGDKVVQKGGNYHPNATCMMMEL